MASPHRSSGRNGLGFAFAFATMLSWSILPIALAATVERLDVTTINATRFVVSFVALAIVLRWRGRLPRLATLSRSNWALLATATLMLAINYVGYIIGLAYTSPADAQMVIQIAPLLLALAGVFFFREAFGAWQWVGFGALVAGLVTFSSGRFGSVADFDRHLLGNLAILLAAVTWAIYGVAQKQLLRVLEPQHIMVCVYGGCALLFLPVSTPSALGALDGLGWGLLLFCAANTLIGYGALAEALQHWEASRVSAVLALVPLGTLASQTATATWWPTLISTATLSNLAITGAATVVSGSLLVALCAPSVRRQLSAAESIGDSARVREQPG